MKKKILLIDMDGVIVDLQYNYNKWVISNPEHAKSINYKLDSVPGIFRNPPPIAGSINAIHKLYDSEKYDMFIATTSPWDHPEASTDKRYWIEHWFGDMFKKKMFITHRKDMLVGDILIDDRLKNGASEFQGQFIHFGSDKYPGWPSVIKELL